MQAEQVLLEKGVLSHAQMAAAPVTVGRRQATEQERREEAERRQAASVKAHADKKKEDVKKVREAENEKFRLETEKQRKKEGVLLHGNSIQAGIMALLDSSDDDVEDKCCA